jgi:hypothetical protein
MLSLGIGNLQIFVSPGSKPDEVRKRVPAEVNVVGKTFMLRSE